MTKTKASPAFRTLLKSIDNQELVVPLLRSALHDPSFKSFTIEVEGFETRPPNGWFWPSTHPLWSERLLYEYLVAPERLIMEPMDPTGTLAVTAGTFFHTFVQTVLVREGTLEKMPTVCGCGIKHPERAEVFLVDEEAGTRGHSDGVVYTGDGFEFKTMNPMKLGRLPQGAPDSPEVLAWFLEKCPGYYAQAQEYLRMSGRKRMVVVIVEMTYPFTMREIHVAYDHAYATATREKYLRVRQAAADQRAPFCECGPKNNDCPARALCWR